MDDISDDDGFNERSQQDWKNITEKRIKDGYREGISTGQEATLQDGFNKGFLEHLNDSLSHGFMSGVLSGLLAMQAIHGIPNLTEADFTTLRDLLQRIEQSKAKQHEVASLNKISRADTSNTSTSPGTTASEMSTLEHLTVTGDQREHTKEDDDSSNINVHDQRDIIQRDFRTILKKLDLPMLANYQPAVD